MYMYTYIVPVPVSICRHACLQHHELEQQLLTERSRAHEQQRQLNEQLQRADDKLQRACAELEQANGRGKELKEQIR